MNRNENSKTLWFLAVAAVLVAVAWMSRPVAAIKTEAAVIGKKLFPEFSEPGAVDNLQVLQYDQAKGQSVALEVAKLNGLWVIPSHSKYPADAKEHLAAAANSLIDLTIIGLAPGFSVGSSSVDETALRKAHNRFGVVDPDPKNVKSSDDGIGTRVTMKDAAGHQLASAIIGKPVPDQPDQCYIRVVGKDQVYVVKLDTGKLSVRFDDWIEPNLLNLNTMDLKKIDVKDYTFTITPVKSGNQVVLEPVQTFKGEFVLDTPAGDQPWKLAKELALDPSKEKMVSRPLAADEELNVTSLDALKSALEDLKIVDVERKPAAVPADLRVRKVDEETLGTLMERGFFMVPISKDPDVPQEIFSNSGDISLQLADGARYILRFGVTTGESSAAEKKKKGAAKSDKDDKAKDDTSPGMDRYLMVTADFNQDAVAKPVLDKLPEEKPAEKTPEKKAGDKKAADKKADGDKKGTVKKDEGKKDAPAKPADVKKDEAKKDDVKKGDAAKEAMDPAALAAKRAEVEKENKRRQEEYDGKVAAGKKHAKELSDRFAQWYYVIPGQTYAKIHLDRKEIVKKKEPPKDAAGHDHEHDHSHDGAGSLPPSPAATVEQLKKDAPAAPEKK